MQEKGVGVVRGNSLENYNSLVRDFEVVFREWLENVES